LPHSDIHGSKPARGSPWLFAACHVLHRLLVPRHPPNALIALKTTKSHAQEPSTPGLSIRIGMKPEPAPWSSQAHISRFSALLCVHSATLGSDTRSRHAQMRTNLFTLTKNTSLIRPHTPAPPHSQVAPGHAAQSGFPVTIPASAPARKPWWRRTGSNRRPPACKAGALPAELRPHPSAGGPIRWWAREDLNLRPHAYQACALTN
jgi:hypothetical protein